MDMQGAQGLGPEPGQGTGSAPGAQGLGQGPESAPGGAQGLGDVNTKGSAAADERTSEQPTLMSLLLTVFRKELARKLGVSQVVNAGGEIGALSSSTTASSSSSSSLYDATVMVMVSMVKLRCSHTHSLSPSNTPNYYTLYRHVNTH